MTANNKNAKIIANGLRRTLTGPMWHGDAVNELLRGVSAADALAHPVAGAHSIWELVLHSAAWATIANERLAGRAPESMTAEQDWPWQPATASESAWTEAQARLTEAYNALADSTALLSDEQLAVHVPDKTHRVSDMLSGVIEHGTYHGGQIAILKRALAE